MWACFNFLDVVWKHHTFATEWEETQTHAHAQRSGGENTPGGGWNAIAEGQEEERREHTAYSEAAKYFTGYFSFAFGWKWRKNKKNKKKKENLPSQVQTYTNGGGKRAKADKHHG